MGHAAQRTGTIVIACASVDVVIGLSLWLGCTSMARPSSTAALASRRSVTFEPAATLPTVTAVQAPAAAPPGNGRRHAPPPRRSKISTRCHSGENAEVVIW